MTGGRQAYTVELRRPRGWDRGIESVTSVGASPLAGVVVHSLRDLDEFLGAVRALELTPGSYYEGNIPLPLQSADNDWMSPGGDFVVRIDDVADDLAWVDVTLGAADLDKDGAVTLDIVAGGWSELYAEGFAEGVRVFICGTGDFRYFIDHQHTQLTCTATTFGYEQPDLRWRVNGVALPAGGAGSVQVPAVATFPGPTSSTKESRTATLSWQQTDRTLVLGADPADGNYRVEVEVTVVENGLSAVTSPSAALATADVTGVLVSWEQAYYDAYEDCVRRVRDINDRFSESRVWPRLNPGDPVIRVSTVINHMRDDLGIRTAVPPRPARPGRRGVQHRTVRAAGAVGSDAGGHLSDLRPGACPTAPGSRRGRPGPAVRPRWR